MSIDPAPAVEVVDVASLLPDRPGSGPAVLWSATNQLQTNVVALAGGTQIDWHAERELDVTLTVLSGALTLRSGPADSPETTADVQAPAVVVLPAGTRRSLTAGPDGAVYLTAHRRRTGMLPTVR